MTEDKSNMEQLLSKLLIGVKGCQSRFGSRTELATEDDDSVRRLCLAFEDVFLHGVKGQQLEKSKGLWQRTENLVTSGLRLNTETVSFWPMIKSQLSKHEAERFLLLQYVRTDFGRGRAWLRASLNEHSLERYILVILSLDNLHCYYENWAFLRDPELSAILPQTAAGLGSVLFALVVDNPVLDSSSRSVEKVSSSNVASPVEVAEVADQFLSAMGSTPRSGLDTFTDNAISSTNRDDKKHLSKRKKKKIINVVSFDDDEESQTHPSDLHKDLSSSCSEDRVESSNPFKIPKENPQMIIIPDLNESIMDAAERISLSTPRENKSATTVSSAVMIKGGEQQSSIQQPELSIYSSSLKSVDCISINSVYSDCSERLDFDNMNLSRLEISSSQRLKPVRSDRGSNGDCDNNYNNTLDSSSNDLIPVPNFDSCMAPELDLQINFDPTDLKNLGIISPTTPSCSSEATLHNFITKESNKKSRKTYVSSAVSCSPITLNSEGSVESHQSRANSRQCAVGTSDSINADEMIIKLKLILDREVETVTLLRAQCAEEKRKNTDQIKILEAKVESLTKENEILKHQLKKYVGAVQMLKKDGNASLSRRTSSFGENDDILVSSAHKSDESTSDDAAEYERKLIQVAEMHGELMEFNDHLQRGLRKRDLLIRRLREELVDLRGPLAAAPVISGDEECQDQYYESWDIVDSMSFVDSQSRNPNPTRRIAIGFGNERILINIWIPSAFLTGSANDLHHVYQVFLRIKDTEWNVYRRYSQFYSLHRDMKKKDGVVDSFYFPPKKHLGNKDARFVDDRRRKLQEYLRKVINHTLETNSILAAHPDKKLLVSILPFFGESNSPHHNLQKPQRERSRSKTLFFLSSSSSNRDHQSSSGFTTQASSIQYPQYTGL